MNISKSLMTVAVCIACMLASSCASRTTVAQHNMAPISSPDTLGSTDTPLDLSITESFGKTIVEFPLDSNTQVYADYDTQNNVVLSFDPPSSDIDLPLGEVGLVKTVEKQKDGNKVKELVLSLKSKSKFLLSKQDDGTGRLMLVPEGVVAPSLPDNFISSLNFRQKEASLLIVTHSSLPFEIIPEQGDAFKLSLDRVKFDNSLLKKYDVSKLGSPVQSVVASNDENGNAFLLVDGLTNPPLSVSRRGDETIIQIKPTLGFGAQQKKMPTKAGEGAPSDKEDEAESGLDELNTLFPGMKETYTGQKISIDLQDADIEHVLRLISEVSGYNLVLDDQISGKISLKLVDIPWDQALDLILLQKNLGMVMKGNIIRIAPAKRLEEERSFMQQAREAAAKALESFQNLAPLKTEYLQINYNTAADFEGKVKSFLTSRGSVSADTRTNILIVNDTEETLRRVKSFIKKLDRPERQVLIEARLVYATDEFQRSLGIKWGATYDTETNINSLSEQYRGGVSTTGMNMLNTVNGITLVGEIGKYLGEDLFSLDASLQLGETKNLVKTISSPRILTLNNNRAEIQQGTKLATATESESGGTTTEYEEAVLKISVLPQITPDNKLILDLEISDDSPKSDGRDIDTKQTKTKMMVNDRETIVIGGVQKATETSGINQIPGLGDVPGLGWLFKHDYKTKNKAELLIFIHPRIL